MFLVKDKESKVKSVCLYVLVGEHFIIYRRFILNLVMDVKTECCMSKKNPKILCTYYEVPWFYFRLISNYISY